MNKERIRPILFMGLACVVAAVGLLIYTHKDLTGTPYSEIAAYMEANPHKQVSYTVTVYGGEEPLVIGEQTETIILTAGNQCRGLAEQAQFLPEAITIRLDFTPTEAELSALYEVFPTAELVYTDFTLDGTAYSANCTEVDLSAFPFDDLNRYVSLLNRLPALETILLTDADGQTALSLDEALELQKLCPDLHLSYRFELFGQTVTTDMERLEYFQVHIGDEGLDTIRSIMPLMDRLSYLKLDWCGTSNEAAAALREELSPQCKVVWRVFLNKYYNALTDTYKIYCTEVRYIDLGHSLVGSCEFVKYMPELEVLILADTPISDLEPLRTCKNLTYLELFKTNVTDLSPLSDLPQLEYLNLSDNMQLKDITPLYSLNNLIQVNCTKAAIPWDQVNTFTELHPDTETHFNDYIASTAANWRYAPDESGLFRTVPRYALLKLQIGYEDEDYSRYPTGYLTEEITYESAGITPRTK